MKGMDSTRLQDRSVGELVAEDHRRGAIFKRFGIDFCCVGGRTVQAACDRAGVAYEEVTEALARADRSSDRVHHPDPRGWPLDFVADYIVNVHHAYVRETLPILKQFSQKVARVHGADRPELVKIRDLVEVLADELTAHLAGEEETLFPYIKQLATAKEREGAASSPPPASGGTSPFQAIRDDHETVDELMRRIRDLSADFTPPEGACRTYCATYATLEEFEEDLHWHVHLENNLLLPAAEAVEEELRARPSMA